MSHFQCHYGEEKRITDIRLPESNFDREQSCRADYISLRSSVLDRIKTEKEAGHVASWNINEN